MPTLGTILSRTDPTGHKTCHPLISDCTKIDNKMNHNERAQSWWEKLKVAGTSAAAAISKTYQTYMKTNSGTGITYSGKTSGTMTPDQNVAARDRGHHMNEDGYGPAQLDKSSTNSDAIRGREQRLIDSNGGAQSEGGTSGNAINGISPTNPYRQKYMGAADSEFGEGAAYFPGDHSLEPNGLMSPATGCGAFGDGSCE